jgi:serine/threonine protein kinase
MKYSLHSARAGWVEVYRARDTRLKPEVAIKVMRADLTSDADLRGRFVQEAQAVCALQHPNICVVHVCKSKQPTKTRQSRERKEGHLQRLQMDSALKRSRRADGPEPLSHKGSAVAM